jgi:hypothetical protein
MNIIEEKKAYAKAVIASQRQELARLAKQEKQYSTAKGIEKWIGNEFESSSGLTPEFAEFAKDYKRELKKMLGNEIELISFNRGHFYFSYFMKNKNTGKYAYVMTSDVRHNRGDAWYNGFMVRTAQHDKDYTGGSNDWTSWAELKEKVLKMTQ